MVISGLGASDSSSLITSNAASTSSASVSSNATASSNDGISLDLEFVNSVSDGVQRFTENSNTGHLLYELNAGILGDGSLSDVQSEIDTYTSSLASSNIYESVYTAPSASFLSDLNALKTDAASGNLAAAASDLANAKLASPAVAENGADPTSLASVILEGTNDTADYLQTQGYSAVNAKAEANAITLAFTPSLGLGGSTAGEPPSDPTVTSEITSLATSAATRDSSTTGGTSDPMFNIIESLLQSTAVSDSASLQTLALLNSLYATNGATSTATSKDAASATTVSSYA